MPVEWPTCRSPEKGGLRLLTILSILSVDILAGLALFSFIKPVSRLRFEEITGLRFDEAESLDERGSSE